MGKELFTHYAHMQDLVLTANQKCYHILPVCDHLETH